MICSHIRRFLSILVHTNFLLSEPRLLRPVHLEVGTVSTSCLRSTSSSVAISTSPSIGQSRFSQTS